MSSTMDRSKPCMATFALLCLHPILWGTHAFTLRNPTTGWNSVLSQKVVACLEAKAQKRKKKKGQPSRAGSGGFGKVAGAKTPDVNDGDYSVFPALESTVKETLVPWLGETSEDACGDLPQEITDRLEQIYGFPKFNYAQEAVEEESMSFEDLLSSSNSKQTKSEFGDLLNPPSIGDSYGDLLAVATGEDTESESPQVTNLPLSSLKPFSKFRVLHVDPLLIAVDDFMSGDLCDKYVAMSEAPSNPKGGPMQIRSRTVGKDHAAKSQRTSTTWFHHYKGVPELMAKASRLLGLNDINRWEEPQTVRYRRTEKFTWHLDALAPDEVSSDSGGQRIATLLLYLADLTSEEGGATMFRDLGDADSPLKVRPKKGSALLFFPAAGGINNCPFDIRTLHCGEAVSATANHDKWIAQLWLRQRPYAPTAPSGNSHAAATQAVSDYCAA